MRNERMLDSGILLDVAGESGERGLLARSCRQLAGNIRLQAHRF